MEILSKIFGGLNKVKILRLFVSNAEQGFTASEVAERLKISQHSARKEIVNLSNGDFVKLRTAYRPNSHGTAKIRVKTWQLNSVFPFVNDLRKILDYDIVDQKDTIARRFKGCGRIKLIILSGLFINNNEDGRVDLTVVGDDLNKRTVEKIIHKMEAELGKELKYAVLETEDFNFRLFSGDKFIRDIFDYPYQYALNKLGI